MNRWSSLVGLAALGALVAACGPKTQPFAITHVEKRAVLGNGLKLVVMPDENTNLVQVDVRYEVGAKEDPPGKAGLAHFVEHMMFQHRFGAEGTPIEKRLPTFQVLPQLATFFNAYTNWDTTHYFLQAPKEGLEDLLRLEAARMLTGCDTIPEAEFERELEVVRNEIRQRLGTPDGQVLYETLRAVYPEGHGYREMIGGNDQQLASIKMEDVCKFFEDYYVPANATVIVTGNVDVDEVGKMVNAAFGGIANKAPAPRTKIEPIQIEHSKRVIEAAIERDTINLLFQLPPQNSKEYDAVRIMLFTVAGNIEQYARDWDFGRVVGVSPLGGAYAPVMLLQVEVNKGTSVDEALGYVWKAVAQTRRNAGLMLEGPSYDVEKLTKLHYKQNLISGLESISARAQFVAELIQFDEDLGTTDAFVGDDTFFYEILDRVEDLDYSKYESLVKRVLDKDRAVVLIAKASETGIKGDERASLTFDADPHGGRDEAPVDESEAYRALKAPQSSSILPSAERYTLSNGLRVVLLPFKGLPIVQANLVFDVGSVHESPAMAGLASMAMRGVRLPIGGNAYVTTGVSLRTASFSENSMFLGRGMNIYLETIIRGLERYVKAAEMDQEPIEEYQEQFSGIFKRPSYQRDYTYGMELYTALYGAEHPYVTTGDPTPKTLAKIGRDAALGFIRDKFKAKSGTLIVTGNFDVAEAKRLIEDNFGGWDGGRKPEPVTTVVRERSAPEYIGVVGREGQPQMRTTIAYPAPAGRDDQHPARLVLERMLNERMGQVRAQLGSTYGAYARLSGNLGPNAYTLGGEIDAARAGESLAFMREQIDLLRRGEGFERDFVNARRVVLKSLLAEPTETQALAMRLATITKFGKDSDYYDKLIRQVASVTPAQVKALIAAELAPEREIVVLMADRPTLDEVFAETGLDAHGSAAIRIVDPEAE